MTFISEETRKSAHELFHQALEEDFFTRDITSIATIPEKAEGKAYLLLKEDGCIAGLDFLPHLLNDMKCSILSCDGKKYQKGTILAEIEGNFRKILGYERPLLNFLQHLSGIATYTAYCKELIKDYPCDLLDTRKTTPGWRILEKYAVVTGGGKNHRKDLSDQILIKNNHLSFFDPGNNAVYHAVIQAKKHFPEKKIEVEVRDISMLQEALRAKADVILLDNMDPEQIKQCVAITQKQAYLEASGGINDKNLQAYAKTGVDGISMGALTHSAQALDICLRLHSYD